jgi:hypothetical protein
MHASNAARVADPWLPTIALLFAVSTTSQQPACSPISVMKRMARTPWGIHIILGVFTFMVVLIHLDSVNRDHHSVTVY